MTTMSFPVQVLAIRRVTYARYAVDILFVLTQTL